MQAVLNFPDLSPEIFSISLLGMEFALRWYALAYIVGILIAWRMALMALQAACALWLDETPPMQPDQLEDLVTWIILGVILGGRLGLRPVLSAQPITYRTRLEIRDGLAGWHGIPWRPVGRGDRHVSVCGRRHTIPILSLGDLVAYTVPPGPVAGTTLANFTNAELMGSTQRIAVGSDLSRNRRPGLSWRCSWDVRSPPFATV